MASSFACPKCGVVIEPVPNAEGVIVCHACGVKLRSRAAASAAPHGEVNLEMVLREMRVLRALQEQTLSLLRAQPARASISSDDDDRLEAQATPPPVRSGRRKTVLVIDDDPATRAAAKAALQAADVPVRTVDSGNGALAAIAEEKPDVIAIELEMGGSMGGKDVINMIKATMEWVDIPIVLYTRAAVGGQKEARTTHGADEYVPKGPDGPAALVARIISLFRRA